jgi:hypothetical protein
MSHFVTTVRDFFAFLPTSKIFWTVIFAISFWVLIFDIQGNLAAITKELKGIKKALKEKSEE